jgi:hypothetical protein
MTTDYCIIRSSISHMHVREKLQLPVCASILVRDYLPLRLIASIW